MGVISMTWHHIAITVGTAAVLLLAGYWVLQLLVAKLAGPEFARDTTASPIDHGEVAQPPVWARPIVALSAIAFSVVMLTVITPTFEKKPASSERAPPATPIKAPDDKLLVPKPEPADAKVAATSPNPAASQGGFRIIVGGWVEGASYWTTNNVSLETCERLCLEDVRCQMYELYGPLRQCNFFFHRKVAAAGKLNHPSRVGIKEASVLDNQSRQP